MSYPTISYLDESGNLSSSCKHAIADEMLLKGYKAMVTTRLVDERMIHLHRQGSITFAMSSKGEEACAVASAAATEPGDWLYPQYREAGILFWRGFTIENFIHEMFCDSKDFDKGRQMPNHFGCRDLNVVTVSSPIGTKIPHAAGCAYAMKYLKENSISICYFGDGATSEGDFHVGVNFAAVKKAPVIFFCRNNGYAISTPCCEQFASDGIAPKGVGYGIQAFRCDGNDFFAVHETVEKSRKLCLEGKGPILLEAMTYRMGAHSTSDDPTAYRQDEEVVQWEAKCPIRRLRLYLQKKGLWDEEKEAGLLESIGKEITAAITIGKETPMPPIRSIIEDVYFQVPASLEKQFDEILPLYSSEDK